jgi:hypothetical protein
VFKYIWPTYQPMTYTTIMGISVIMIFGMALVQLACTIELPRLGPGRRAHAVLATPDPDRLT